MRVKGTRAMRYIAAAALMMLLAASELRAGRARIAPPAAGAYTGVGTPRS